MCLGILTLCCLSVLKPRMIELIALISNIIMIGCFIWSAIGIPWEVVNTGGKVVFYIAFGFAVIAIIILIIIMVLRCQNTINGEKNSLGLCLLITIIIVNIIGFVFLIIAEILIINKMRDEDRHSNWRDWTYNSNDYKISGGDWAASAVSFTIIQVFWIILSFCCTCLYKLVDLRTNDCYADYLAECGECNEHRDSTNNQTDNRPTLNFIGYDKNGAPIYQGQPVPIVNPTSPVININNVNPIQIPNKAPTSKTNYGIV